MIYKVKYYVRDTCSVELEADSEGEASEKVMGGDFEEDETFEFLDAEIIDVIGVESLYE